MKRILSVFVLLTLLCGMVLAEAPAYQPVTSYDASAILGMDTHYLMYDKAVFEVEDSQPGTLVKTKYTTNVYDKAYKKTVNVYLPYGDDENGTERYPIIYFFHGNGCDVDTLLGNPETKNALDHMISSGAVQPFILCAATYYYDIRKKVVDLDKFVEEFRTEIMPLVEGKYRTYAETPDEAGFRASRDMRAISGFSRGSMTTWFLFDKMLDVSANFLPFSGGTSDVEALQKAVEATDQDFFIYMACGGEEDTAFEGCNALAKTLAADTEHFSYGPDRDKNNFFYCLSDNIHQDLTSRYYLYNAFLDGLFQ